MSDFDFRGLGVALVTPFDDKEKVDYNCLEMLVRRLVAGNADYIVVLGTTLPTRLPERFLLYWVAAETAPALCVKNCMSGTAKVIRPYSLLRRSTTSLRKRVFTNTLRLWQRLLPCLYCSTMCRAERVSICCRTRL